MKKCTCEMCIRYTKSKEYQNHCIALSDVDFQERTCPFYKEKQKKEKGPKVCDRNTCMMYDQKTYKNHCSGLRDIDFGNRSCPFYKKIHS